MTGRNLIAPESLNIKGRGLSPNPDSHTTNNDIDVSMHSAPTSSRTSISDEEVASGEEYTVLDGVREMNHILVRQIETLRLKIKVDEKNYDNSKANILESKYSEIQEKERDIEDLKDSLNDRDERIHTLMKAGVEKDRTIQNKCSEIESLKDFVKQTEDYATKLQEQIGCVQNERDHIESDELYKQQNEEIGRLTEELGLLRSRLGTMEQELHRAITVIEQQHDKMKVMDSERSTIQARFREDLEKASKAMRQEVERMREVMRQNYEEMRIIREQNREMHNDVISIKNMLRPARSNGHVTSTDLHQHDTVTELTRPLTTSPVASYIKPTSWKNSVMTPIGPGKMAGGNIAHRGHPWVGPAHAHSRGATSHDHPQTLVVESFHFPSRNAGIDKGNNLRISGKGTTEDCAPSLMSPDSTARTVPKGQTARVNNNTTYAHMNLNVPTRKNAIKLANGAQQNHFPPICSIKEGGTKLSRQSSATAGKGIVRKGSAVRNK